MREVTLTFETADDGLNLTGTVNFPDRLAETLSLPDHLHVRGLAEWRHVSANVIHVNEAFINCFNMVERGKPLAKIGISWFGIKARSNILLAFNSRSGKDGVKKVQGLLTKFFRTLGASSVKFSILDTERAMIDQQRESQEIADDKM